MVDDDFNFQYDTSVSQSFHHLLAAVYRLGYDVRCFGSGYLETDFLRYASGVFSDSYQIIEECVRIEERLVTPTRSSKNVFGSKNVFFM